MQVTVFGTHSFDRTFLEQANHRGVHEFVFCEERLSEHTVSAAQGSSAVCLFVNDQGSRSVLQKLAQLGIKLIVLRSAGFNHVDIEAAEEHGLTVLRVPAYSPHAVAEHTIALILALNRKVHRAYNRVREHNFSLDGLLGFDLCGRSAGIIGTGKIGALVGKILLGFGCKVLANDKSESPELAAQGFVYTDLQELYRNSDIISLHCPLTPETNHLINARALKAMKRGAMLINTGRGALVDTAAVIFALKSGQLGYLGIDVYEEEGDLFFRDLSGDVIADDVFALLLTFPNVLVTAHQAFFTQEALTNIAETTIKNISDFERGRIDPANEVTMRLVA